MIVLLETIHPDALAILEAVDEVVHAPDPCVLPDVPSDEVLALVTRGLGRVTAETIDALPALRVVARCGAAVDNIDTVAAAARDVAVVYAPGVNAMAVAEHAVMLMLCLARDVVRLATATADGRWSVRDGFESVELAGRRLGVVGLGHIGGRVATLGAALGMDVVAWTRTPRQHPAARLIPLDDLLAASDVVQLCVALTPETTRLVDAHAISRMRQGALIVNTGRGPLVDHAAIGEAIRSGQLGGYATDVWDPEPPAADDALVRDPRVLVTPHVASFTDRTYRQLCVVPSQAVAAIICG
jgi:phosphoglycerate dehydrogenase-like enzyme